MYSGIICPPPPPPPLIELFYDASLQNLDSLSVDNVLGKYCHQLIKSKQALDVFNNYCFCLSTEISALIENIMVTRYALPCEPTEAFVRHQCNLFNRLYFIHITFRSY